MRDGKKKVLSPAASATETGMPRACASRPTRRLTSRSSDAATASAAPSRSSAAKGRRRSSESGGNPSRKTGLTARILAPHRARVSARRSATAPPPTTSAVSPSTSRIRGKNGGRPRPSIRRAQRTASPTEQPASSGRVIRTTPAPAARAPASLASIPPGPPPSLVTRSDAPVISSMARFSSAEKGPCIAMRCAGPNPNASQARSTSDVGSTRAKSRLP